MRTEQWNEVQKNLKRIEEALEATDPLRNYLQEVAKVEPLTEEEVGTSLTLLAAGYQARLELEQALSLSQAEIDACKQAVLLGEREKQRLVEANLCQVVFAAKRCENRGISLIDLIMEGNLGLLRAVDRLEMNHKQILSQENFSFDRYIQNAIRRSIAGTIMENRCRLKIPVHLVEELQRYAKAERHLQEELGRKPEPEEMADELNVSVERVWELMHLTREPEEKEVEAPEDDLKKPLSNWDRLIRAGWTRDEVEETLSQQDSREAQVLRLRLGLEDGREHTLDEVAEELQVIQARIRQIEARGVRKLLAQKRKRKIIRDFLE